MHINDLIKQDVNIFLNEINSLQTIEGNMEFIKIVCSLCINFYNVDYKEGENLNYKYDSFHNKIISDNLDNKTNPFVVARLHHYLFCNKSLKFDDGKIAYNNYLECISKENDFEFNCSCLFSAYYIYCKLGKQFDVKELKQPIQNISYQVNSNDNAFALHFYNLLLDLELIDLEELLSICDGKMNTHIINNSNIFDGYYNLKKLIYKVEKEKKLITHTQYLEYLKSHKLFKADLYYELAQLTDISYSKEYYLKICIKIYKECKQENSKKFFSAKEMLDECEKENLNNMKISSTSINSSKLFNIFKEKVDSYTEQQNLFFLLFFMPIISQTRSEEIFKKNIINRDTVKYFSTALMNSEGKTIAIIPPFNDNDEEIVNMYTMLTAAFETKVKGQYILYLIKLIKKKHPNIIKLINDIIDNTSIIKEKNKHLVKKGFYYCIFEDFDCGMSILIPQIESSIRELAHLCGVSTYTLNQDNTETFNTLSSIIERESFVNIIDEDVVFNLRFIFDSKYGLNLRNNFAHGFISNFNKSENYYAMWFYLVIIYMYSKLN